MVVVANLEAAAFTLLTSRDCVKKWPRASESDSLDSSPSSVTICLCYLEQATSQCFSFLICKIVMKDCTYHLYRIVIKDATCLIGLLLMEGLRSLYMRSTVGVCVCIAGCLPLNQWPRILRTLGDPSGPMDNIHEYTSLWIPSLL